MELGLGEFSLVYHVLSWEYELALPTDVFMRVHVPLLQPAVALAEVEFHAFPVFLVVGKFAFVGGLAGCVVELALALLQVATELALVGVCVGVDI